jgi:hypothetical protein
MLDGPLVLQRGVPVLRRFSGGGTVVVDGGTVFATLIMQVGGSRPLCSGQPAAARGAAPRRVLALAAPPVRRGLTPLCLAGSCSARPPAPPPLQSQHLPGVECFPGPIMRWTERLYGPLFSPYGDFRLREHGARGGACERSAAQGSAAAARPALQPIHAM